MRLILLSAVLAFVLLACQAQAAVTNCTNCTDCNSKIASASGGDVVRLNSSISNYQNGTCILFSAKNNVTFDCLSHTIDGNDTGGSYGIWLNDSSGSAVRNCTVTDFGYGIFAINISNSSLISITASSNTYGMLINTSSFNYVMNLTASGNTGEGMEFGSAQYNTINDSRIENSTNAGIYFTNSTNNLFYNNYLNNTVNLYSNNNSNSWNVSLNCSAVPNIIGGPCIGGNYWTDPVGGNYSDGCADADGNGICDSSYSIDGNSTDYLPLAENPPQLVFFSPASNGSTISNSWLLVNVSANETLSWCMLDWYNGSGWQNVSMNVTGGNCYRNMTTLMNKTSYYFRVYGNDSTGHMNVTWDRQATTSIPGDCYSCGECSERIRSAALGDTVRLNTSLTGINVTCISFGGKDNVTFDCLGNSINGTDAVAYGIWLNDSNGGSNNNTVRNCIVSDFYEGVYLDSSSDNTLTNITASSCAEDGFALYPDANNNTLSNLIASSNYMGVFIYLSRNNTLSNITITKAPGQTGILDQASPPYRNSIGNTVTVNGKPVQVFDGYYKPCPDNQVLDYNSTYSQVTFLGCLNVTLMSAAVSDSVNLFYTNNSRVYNVNSSYSEFGFGIDDSWGNIFSNITTGHNSMYGIYIYNSSNNTLSGITSNSNAYYGIWMLFSHNNTFGNVTTNSNSYSGIYLAYVSRNTFTNFTSEGNDYGIQIEDLSEYNTVNSSMIRNNTLSGIYLGNSTTYPRYNFFYNNIFNNSLDLNSTSMLNHNYWNASNSTGPNIMGGKYIGGNFWSSPFGNGTSENCTDSNHDGYCDSNHTLDGNNTDYLPLAPLCIESWSCSDWSGCSGGIQTRTCADANSCGTAGPSLSQSCSGPSGGGGGGSPTPEPPQVEKSWEKIEPGAAVSFSINKSGLEFSEIKIQVCNHVNNISIKVTKLEGKPAEVSHEVSGKAYQYVAVNTTNLNQSSLNSTQIKFKVSKSWISQNNIDRNRVYLNRYESGAWKRLNTTCEREDSLNIYYIAESPGFSFFVITGEMRASTVPVENQTISCNNNGMCESGENSTTCPDCMPQKQCEAGMFMCHNTTLDGCQDGIWTTYMECKNGCLNARCLEASPELPKVDAVIIIIAAGAIAIAVELVLWRKKYSPWRYFRI